MSELCFHCGEPLSKTVHYLPILGEERPLCCLGCYAVAQTIVENQLENYYLERSVISPTAPLLSELETLKGYDHPDTQQQFIHREQNLACADLSVAGVSCAVCALMKNALLKRLRLNKQLSI